MGLRPLVVRIDVGDRRRLEWRRRRRVWCRLDRERVGPLRRNWSGVSSVDFDCSSGGECDGEAVGGLLWESSFLRVFWSR